jgi:C-lobe and N-lobe beta barrels of Tf-binding protein B
MVNAKLAELIQIGRISFGLWEAIMRIVSVSVLVLSGIALTGCGAGEFGDTTCATISITDPCVTAATSTTTTTTTTPIVPLPVGVTPSTNTGNTTTLTTGDQTIALEFSNLISPTAGSRSALTEGTGTAKLAIDTETSGNTSWPIPKTMAEYVAGTVAKGDHGPGGLLGATYHEYRDIDFTHDEELQVWHWTDSYVTQYRDLAAGGEAAHQAWSFGGNATATMPAGGAVTYTGDYGATAKTWNWVNDAAKSSIQTIDSNGSWAIEGTSSIDVDFAAHTVLGTLTPHTWTGWKSMNGETGLEAVDAGNPLGKNFQAYMDDNVIINGTITGNKMSGGKAKLDIAAGWVNGTNPAYAGFFGPSATEIAGAFNFVAINPDPIGSHPPINNDRRGYIQESGVFHGYRP